MPQIAYMGSNIETQYEVCKRRIDRNGDAGREELRRYVDRWENAGRLKRIFMDLLSYFKDYGMEAQAAADILAEREKKSSELEKNFSGRID